MMDNQAIIGELVEALKQSRQDFISLYEMHYTGKSVSGNLRKDAETTQAVFEIDKAIKTVKLKKKMAIAKAKGENHAPV
ncbi:MAG: hypothetical protein GY749_22900 [Desulfobacteraceae bacterium]|nr:hypothetical protein [Desulfobacteraceae bacterium]